MYERKIKTLKHRIELGVTLRNADVSSSVFVVGLYVNCT